jgi:hypothetical protein
MILNNCMQIEWFLHGMILLEKMGNKLIGVNFSLFILFFSRIIF